MNSSDCPYRLIAPDVKLGKAVRVHGFTNLYGCEVGDESRIGTFVEIQKGAQIGKRCKISSHTFICEGVTIEDEVFIGHNVTFINDRFPRATNGDGQPQAEADWDCQKTIIRRGASIGSAATLLGGVTVGEYALVGAGSVVTTDVPAHAVVAGNPARILRILPHQTPPQTAHAPKHQNPPVTGQDSQDMRRNHAQRRSWRRGAAKVRTNGAGQPPQGKTPFAVLEL